MKKLVLLLIFATCISSVNSFGQKSIKCLFEELKEDDKSFALSLPGWLIRKGLNIALKESSEKDKVILEKYKDSVKKLRVLVLDGSTEDHSLSFNKFLERAAKDKLDLYATFKENKNNVSIYVQEKKERIKHLLFMVKSDDTIALVHLQADIAVKEFKEEDFSFNKN